jgi:hypothetical protein
MYFPTADVTVNPFFLAGVGFLVGMLGGFYGVGGGGPGRTDDVPGRRADELCGGHRPGAHDRQVHRRCPAPPGLGHVDIKLGLLMVLGTIPGIKVGARIIERLEATGSIDLVVGVAYIVILLAIGVFTA